MYKDVWKRILALAVAVCMIGTSIQWPEQVMAAEVSEKDYHTYQHGAGSSDGFIEKNTAAAVFTVGQNTSGEAEILDSVSFHAHIEEGTDRRATVSFYVNPQDTPDSGTFVHAKTISELTEGQNTVDADMESWELTAGTTIAVVVSLEGASLGYSSAASAGETYVSVGGSWQDASELGQCAIIRAYTYDVGDDGEDGNPGAMDQIVSAFSLRTSTLQSSVAAISSGATQLNKTNMVVPKDGCGEITLNDADGGVEWSVSDPLVAEIVGTGKDAVVHGLTTGETTINATYGDVTYTCTLKVTSSIEDATLSLTPERVIYDGVRHCPELEVKIGDTTLVQSTDYQLNCYSVNEDGTTGAQISLTDTTQYIDAGTYCFEVVGEGMYAGTQKTIDYVIEPRQITEEAIAVELDSWEATQSTAYVKSVTDTGIVNTPALTLGDETTGDYYLKLVTNDAGESIGVNVIGRGNYAGTRYCAAPQSIANAQITFDLAAYVYLGRDWQPSISVAVGGVILSEEDYRVAYAGNRDAGTAKVTVTGQNEYYGTTTAEFEILPKDISNADSALIQTPVEVTVSNAVGNNEPNVVVTYNGMTLERGTDYTAVCDNTTGTCTITAAGTNYKGTRTERYTVVDGDISGYTVEASGMTYTGEALTPAVILKDASGNSPLREGVDYTVTYTDNIDVGTATVKVQGIGAYGGIATGSFEITKANFSDFSYWYQDASGNAVSTTGYQVDYSPLAIEDMMPKVIVKNGQDKILTEGVDYQLDYSINGKTTSDVLAGSWTVTIKPVDTANYEGSKELTYTIQKCNLLNAVNDGRITVTLSKENFNYTGTVQTPSVTVAYAAGSGQELQKDTDYTVTYSTAASKDVGEYQVIIEGKGNYTGTVVKNYKITKIDIQTIKTIEPNTSQDGYVTDYTGPWPAMLWYNTDQNKNKLELIIKDNNGNVLVKDTDYTLSYENIDQVSDSSTFAKVTITGRGTYTGERELYYLLAGKLEDYEVSITDEELVYTGEKITLQKDNVTVQSDGILWWKDTLEQGVDYQLEYADNVDAGTATFTVEPVDDDQLPTVNGCYRYSDTSQKLTGNFVIKQKDISDESTVLLTNAIVMQYDPQNTPITLEVTNIPLTYNGTELTATDFEVKSCTNNDGPSNDASVTITGKGNYTGTRVIPFVIKGKSLDNVQAEVEQLYYTGAKLYPTISSLKTEDGTTELIEGQDFTYEHADYQNNVNAGEGTITIHGLGDYLGSTAEIPFVIKPANLDGTTGGTCIVEGIETTGYTYTSQEIRPDVIIKYLTGATAPTLTEGTDYTVAYYDNLNVTNAASVVITGMGNYTGTYEKIFVINPKNIADDDVTVAKIPSQEYNGGIEVKPTPSISYSYGDADADVYQLGSGDYTLTYQNAASIGTATITITGTGNFEGSREVNYHIGNSILDTSKVSISCPDIENGVSFVYTGSAYKPEVVVTNLTNGEPLEKGTDENDSNADYIVRYGENTNVGVGTVTVEGIGAYAGEKEFTFNITPKNLADSDITLSIAGAEDGSHQATYTGSPIEPEVVLTYNGKTVDSSEYDVNYGTNHTSIGFVNITVTARSGSNLTGTIQNTQATKFEIVSASIGDGGTTPAAGFTMEAIEPQPLGTNGTATPTPKLYYNGTALAAGIDYVYSYEKNNAIGSDAVVILTGIGNYSGSVRQKFTICGSIEGATVEVADEIWYKDYVDPDDGTLPTEITFDDMITVTVGDVELVQGTDYEISYADNSWVGMATVTIKGKGNYAGIVKQEVPIQADLSETTVTIGDQKYTGSPIKVVPIVEYYDTVLTEGQDFFIHTYSNNTNLTDKGASVTIVGNEKNGFSGTVTANFSITADAGALTVSGVEDSYIYRGTAIEPSVTVKLGNVTLKSTDYEVTYGTNTDVGYGTIVVKGNGSYAGFVSEVITFDITPQNISALTVLDGTSNVFADREYTGTTILPEVALTAKVGTQTYTMPTTDYTVTAKTDNVSVGTVTLEITGTGNNITGSREVTFNITPKSLSKPTSDKTDTISVQVTQDTFTYDGTAKTPSVVVTYQYGSETEVRTLEKDKDYTVSYSNNVAAGTANVTVSGIGNYAGARTEKFTITAQDMSAATVTLPGGSSYQYLGSTVGVEPEVIVTLKGITLTKDKDYTVSYQNNKACGTATVVVTGKGDFSGSTTATFTIEPHSINAADVTVASIPNQAYTGSPVVPDVIITYGTYKLVKGVDYELACTGNTEIGQAAVTIKGINGFKDSRTEIFMIASSIEKAEVSGLKDSYAYTGSVLTQEQLGITEVRIGETVLTTSDYTIGYAYGSDGMSAGTQTLQVIGTGNYGGIKEFDITITPKSISDSDVVMLGFEDTLPYAETLTQNITLTWGTFTLQKGTDYEVTCSPSEGAATYLMTVTGKGNYTGTIERSFKVDQTDIADIEVKDISSNYTYTGSAIEPKPVVKLAGAELTEGKDYTLTYLNNVNAGVATIRISGTGTHYTGEKDITFAILRRSINHATFGEIANQVYTGKDIEPVVTVTENGVTLVENKDYTLMYKNNVKTGVATVTVAGKGNYTSTKTIPFAIRPCNVTNPTVTGKSSTTVSLSWKSAGVVTGYEIYRMGPDGKWQLVGGTKQTTYTDAKLSANTSYSYKIRSYVVEGDETYYGEFSTVVTATTSK